MSTEVRKSGFLGNANPRYNSRAVFNRSDGTAVAVIHDTNDPNTSGANQGDKTGVEKIYVYSSTDRITWTLRTTITPPITGGRLTANVGQDNRLGIVYYTTTAVRYIEVSTAWVASAAEAPRLALTAPNTEDDYDLAYTVGNVPVIMSLRENTTGSTRLQLMCYVKETTGSTWVVTTIATLLTSTTPRDVYQALSFTTTAGGSATARRWALSVGFGTGTVDSGVRLYSGVVSETTGVVTTYALRATVASGEIPGSSTAARSRYLLMQPGAGTYEWNLAIMHQETKRFAFMRGQADASSGWTVDIPYTAMKAKETDPNVYGMAASYSYDRMNFVFSDSLGYLHNYIARIANNTATYSGALRYFDNNDLEPKALHPLGGGGRHVSQAKHDILYTQKIASDKQIIRHHYAVPDRAPAKVNPAAGATIQSSTPPLRAWADLDIKLPQGLTKIRWQFATDVNFTTNLVTYDQPDSKFQLVERTHKPDATVLFSDVLPSGVVLTQSTWYVRAAHISELGVVGAYTAPQSFVISHVPAAALISPNGYKSYAYAAGGIPHEWMFSDPSPTDSQSAYQITVERIDTGAVVATTGKVASTTQTANVVVGTAYKNLVLRSKIVVWDADDKPSPESDYVYWILADAPTIGISAPVGGSTVTTAIPAFTFSPSFVGDREVVGYQVEIVKAGVVVGGTDGFVTTSLASGASQTYIPDPELLVNSSAYDFRVRVIDSWGLMSGYNYVTIYTNWTPPATATGVAVNQTVYNTEGLGYVEITWADTARDPDWIAWAILRRVEMLDTNGQVLVDYGWKALDRVTTSAATYSYKDYYAPSSYRVTYRVEQQVSRFGDVVTSTTGVDNVVVPVSDSYWVIDPERSTAWRLGTVTDDQYTEEYEESEYFVIGRGRHVDTGERIGYAGTLTAQLRDSVGVSARQKKLRLEQMKEEERKLYLRNPFGDLFRVSVRAMSVSRIAGVGLSEFVDVTIPYSEVGE